MPKERRIKSAIDQFPKASDLMNIKVRVETALLSDARQMTSIQAEAYDHEAAFFKIDRDKGPPGYDSIDSMRESISNGNILKIVMGDEVIGGVMFTVKEQGRARLNRIFIDPSHQGNGFGSAALSELKRMNPKVEIWELDTPSWSLRNKRFCEKNGFVRESFSLSSSSGYILYIYRFREAKSR